ncbi:PREDICTED: transcription factor MYB98 [Tarenaya hassleriana]|uniref:transcription factor MYB98 n=1 Tax=Tarenaya hassleriana TaxID=28532 RepID=UPI00053C151C|nr:PREDICTED: transcription factor MYB98 [Tarenaya hassleriana]
MENFDESDFPVSQTLFLTEEEQQHMKPQESVEEDEDFPFEIPNQSKPTNFLQDFHHLDPFNVDGSSSNPLFGVQTACNDPFEPYPYVCSSAEDIGSYESKPFSDSLNVIGGGRVMNKYQTGENNPYFGNIPRLFDHRIPEQSNMMMMTTAMMMTIPFDYHADVIKPVNFVIPDEVSCVSAENNSHNAGGGLDKSRAFPTRKSWKGRKRSTVVKGQWTVEEDRILIQLVEQYGLRKWSHIAQMLPGRIGKQCRERWHNHLRPDIKKETWSEDEDKILIEAHKEIGNKWAEIMKRLPGRTENSIKNHWNATKRRQFSKRKCRSKFPRPSLLQDYIKSLNLDASSSSIPARGRRKHKKKNEKEPEEMEEGQGLYDFGFDEKMLEEGCSIDSLLDDIPLTDMDAFVHGF